MNVLTFSKCCICKPSLSKSRGQHVLTAEAVVADVVLPINFNKPFKIIQTNLAIYNDHVC